MVKAVVVSFAALLVSCSDDSSTGTTSSGGGSGSAVSLDASRIFKGSLTLSGTFTMPAGTGAGKSVQLTVSGGGADITTNGSQVGNAGSTPGDQVPYTITGLGPGQYSVRARVDVDGDGTLASGDLDGFSGGTIDAPITDFAGAKKVELGASGATGVDFGLAKVP